MLFFLSSQFGPYSQPPTAFAATYARGGIPCRYVGLFFIFTKYIMKYISSCFIFKLGCLTPLISGKISNT